MTVGFIAFMTFGRFIVTVAMRSFFSKRIVW